MYSFRLRFIVAAVALTLIASAAPVSATTIYSLPAGYSQNQAYAGTLGMDFTVNAGYSVTIDALGALSDGASTITVAIFNVSTEAIVAGAQTSVSTAGAYAFSAITPVTLTPGIYQIAAWGYNGNNQNYNPAEPSGVGQLSFDSLNGALTAGGAYYNDVAGQIGNTFDTGTSTYGAGNFDVAATPLPTTWIMMLAGVGAIGLLGRRRKRTNNAVVTTT